MKQAIEKNTSVNKPLLSSVLDEINCILIIFLEVIGFVIIVYYSINVAFSAESQWNEQQYKEITLNDVTQGSLLYKTDAVGRYITAPTVSTDVEISVTGILARVIVSQEFKNNSKDWQEALYVFPLPENAAVDHMKMIIGSRIIEGKIKERAEAKRIYNQAKKQGKKVSLIEQHRPNLFQNSIANIAPGETIKVVIEYQQTIDYQVTEKQDSRDNKTTETAGFFNLRFPMTLTPRYIPGKVLNEKVTIENIKNNNSGWAKNTNLVNDAKFITPPQYSLATATDELNKISLRVELNTGFPIESIHSDYHRVTKVNHGEGVYTVTLVDTNLDRKNNIADADFSLTWQTAVGEQPRAAVFSEQYKGSFYNLLMIMPPNKINRQKGRLNREVIFILDTSGSMGGASIRQARKALIFAIERLGNKETFNVIEFNSTATKLFNSAVQATRTNKVTAKYFVRNLTANGGTEMASALNLALENEPRTENRNSKNSNTSNKLRQIIFLTDGSVGNEDHLFSLIKEKLGASRLFTVGIGSAPNSHFMTKAALFGRGTFTYIGAIDEVERKMKTLFSKLESPVLKNIQIKFDTKKQIESWPTIQPDLYLGEPIVVVTKSKEKMNNVGITAELSTNRWNLDLAINNTKENEGIHVLWARKKINSLMNRLLERNSQSKKQLKDNVTLVALKHHLVSKYTSLVAVEIKPSRNLNALLKISRLKNNQPKGMKLKPQAIRLAKTATSASLNIIYAVLLLLVAGFMLWYQRRAINQ